MNEELKETEPNMPDVGVMANKKAVYKTLLWFLTCSNCGNCMADTDDEGTEIATNFCPNCGAKIIGFEKETCEEIREKEDTP